MGLSVPMVLLGAVVSIATPVPSRAYVALMAGQSARPLQGQFNQVPVLHSNQPEEVLGPGILVSTVPGYSTTAESGQSIANAGYTFQGDFGVHIHHKYFPQNRTRLGNHRDRGALTLAAILVNPGSYPVRLTFQSGAVRNSFEAPYLPNYLLGVKPLGPRPWNTGPGDATAVQMLRGRLDPKLPDELIIPPRSSRILFSTDLPARGIANAIVRGRSDGPFQMAVVAAEDPRSDYDILNVLDSGRLAPGRVYLSRLREIESGAVFSRVAGVAIGDSYVASLTHDLNQSALHVPLTSTTRHHFGTQEVQVNRLAVRMVDSSLDNVGTYGVRFDLNLNLQGQGPYDLVMSHPSPNGRQFTAFRGSIGIETPDGYREVHVGMRSGESLSLASLNLPGGQPYPLRLSLVYPADSTPGHLLSVVPSSQLALIQERERQLQIARAEMESRAMASRVTPPPPNADGGTAEARPRVAITPPPAPRAAHPRPGFFSFPSLLPPPALTPPALTLPGLAPALIAPGRTTQSLIERYQEAVEAQQRLLNRLRGR